MGTAFVCLGLDRVWPNFLTDDFSANRVRMGAVGVTFVAALVLWMQRVNRRFRHFALFDDRLEIGRPPNRTVRFGDIIRIRVGAPMPGGVKRIAKFNRALGALSPRNAAAAEQLALGFANAVVLDTAEGSVVFHVGTVENGHELLAALIERNASKLADPEYTEAERARFGRFKPGLYR